MTLITLSDVEEMAASLDAGQMVNGVRLAEGIFRTNISRGDFDTAVLSIVQQWLDLQTAHRAAAEANTPQGLARRNTEATERAALAAERSAKYAAIAIGISIVALAVAAWPLLPMSR